MSAGKLAFTIFIKWRDLIIVFKACQQLQMKTGLL